MSQQETSKLIYLDNIASQSDPKFTVDDDFANPSSTHEKGRQAFEALEKAREDFSKLINAKRPSELIWTSGATESNNLAILGISKAVAEQNNRKKIIVFEIEHESSIKPALSLEKMGFDVELLKTDRNGFAKIQNFMEICDDQTALVIVQHANTEISSIQNVKQIAAIAHENGAYFHCDCAGSFGSINVDVQDIGMDTASFSGHKVGAPKGIGVLYIKQNTPIKPIMYGGHQEQGIRPGTISVALACSFAKAAKDTCGNHEMTRDLYQSIIHKLATEIAKLDGVRLTVGFPENKLGYLWNIFPLIFKNINSKELVLQYGKRGFSVTGGPACSAASAEPSHVLKAIGVPKEEIFNSIRLSFSKYTTLDEIERFLEVTKEILSEN